MFESAPAALDASRVGLHASAPMDEIAHACVVQVSPGVDLGKTDFIGAINLRDA